MIDVGISKSYLVKAVVLCRVAGFAFEKASIMAVLSECIVMFES